MTAGQSSGCGCCCRAGHWLLLLLLLLLQSRTLAAGWLAGCLTQELGWLQATIPTKVVAPEQLLGGGQAAVELRQEGKGGRGG
jgi:hypothetical protein